MSLNKVAELTSSYAGIPTGRDFTVVETGYDWVQIRYRGKAMYVPSNIVKVKIKL